jgi:hypothetical protein
MKGTRVVKRYIDWMGGYLEANAKVKGVAETWRSEAQADRITFGWGVVASLFTLNNQGRSE